MSCTVAKAHFLLCYHHTLFDRPVKGEDPRVELLAKQLPSINCATTKKEGKLLQQIQSCVEKNPAVCSPLIRKYKNHCEDSETKKIATLVSEQMALNEQGFLKRKQQKELREKIFFLNMPFC